MEMDELVRGGCESSRCEYRDSAFWEGTFTERFYLLIKYIWVA